MSARVSLPDKVVAVDAALGGRRIAHAFGGALALAYYAEPRATIDIDVNIFLPPAAADRVESALAPLGVAPNPDREALARNGQARWRWDEVPIDLFFADDPIHDAMQERIRRVPFGDIRIPILSPEHLLICKVVYDRTRDWLDIEQMLLLEPDMDQAEVAHWLNRFIAADDPRRERLDHLFARAER